MGARTGEGDAAMAVGSLIGDVYRGVNRSIVERGNSPQQLVFRELVLQYQTLRDPPPASSAPGAPARSAVDPRVREAIEGLIDKGKQGPLSWLELYDLESLILRLLDDDSLRDESWSLREEFRRLATEELYKAYLDSRPPADPRDPDTPAALVRRDVESLLRKLHELRLGRAMLDVIRAYTTGLTFGVTVFLVLVTLLVSLLNADNAGRLPVLLLVIVGGVFGAGLSMLQRLSQIPAKGDLVARYPAASRRVVWILTPLLSLTQGSLAAIVLYFVFRAGLLRGLIFPDFTLPVLSGPHLRSPMDELLHGELPSVIEAAKLLIWSLVARHRRTPRPGPAHPPVGPGDQKPVGVGEGDVT
jgi:hypothetical protein